MFNRTNGRFCFVATEPISQERLNIGFIDKSNDFPFVLKSYENDESYKTALKLGLESDVVIMGDAPDEFIKERLKQNKLTFRYYERFFKEGRWRILDPRVLRAHYKQDFKYRNFMALFSYFTMIFGGGLVPTFIVVKQVLHLGDSLWAVIISPLLSPFFIIMLRTFFQTSVPEELIEAASIDGSGEYRTLLQIVIPISKPGIATVALLTALNYWNDWFLSMLYIKDNTKFVLQYLLMRMQNDVDFIKKNQAMVGAGAQEIMKNLPNLTLRMAMVVFVVVPITLAYPFFQRYIIGGLTVGSVKG